MMAQKNKGIIGYYTADGLILTVICAYPNDADRQTQTKTKIFTKFFILLPISF